MNFTTRQFELYSKTIPLLTGEICIQNHYLVNNAGVVSHKNWSDAAAEDWLEVYNANVVSYVRMIRRIVPQMKQLGWGRVINIGGGLAIQPIKEQPHYNATLAARHNLSVSLARQLQETGITSNGVSPGAIMNPMVEEWLVNAAPKFGWVTHRPALLSST